MKTTLMEQNKTKQNIRFFFIQRRTQGYKVQSSSNVLIQDESLIFQDALDTVKN